MGKSTKQYLEEILNHFENELNMSASIMETRSTYPNYTEKTETVNIQGSNIRSNQNGNNLQIMDALPTSLSTHFSPVRPF